MIDRDGQALAEVEAPTTWTFLVGFSVLIYYIGMWSLSMLGLNQARQLFGRARKQKRLGELPLQHDPTPVPASAAYNANNGSIGRLEQGVADSQHTGVSILRPLAGLDHNLSNNLASAFEQRYPQHLFEIILSVRDASDQALPVARSICARYPEVRSQIIVGDEPAAGVNPKVANLVKSYASAAFDIVWVLDSQVHISPYALARAANALNAPPRLPVPQTLLKRRPHGPRVGLAHHVPLGVTPLATSFGSHIEAIFLGTNHAKMYLAINSLSLESCVMGKSNLYRKSDLAQIPDEFFKVESNGTRGESGAIGSIAFEQSAEFSQARESLPASKGAARPLARFGIYLAEDNMLATALWKRPLTLAHTLVATDVARTSVADVKSLRAYWQRRVRWIRVRRHMVPSATFIEPFTESIVCGTIATTAVLNCWLPILGVHTEGSMKEYIRIAFFTMHMLVWHLVDFEVLKAVQSSGAHDEGGDGIGAASASPLVDLDDGRQVWKFRLAWLAREVLALPIWIAALFGNTVDWRGRKFKVLSDGRAALMDSDKTARPAIIPVVDGWLPRIAVYLGWDGKPRPGSRQYQRISSEASNDP